MKRIFSMLALLVIVFTSFAKEKKDPIDLDVYGVDFSAVNVIGALEEDSKFFDAFAGINDLLISEPKKYDIAKLLKVNVKSVDCDLAKERINELKKVSFRNKETSIDLAKIVSHYPETSNYGLVVVAKELNKATNKGHFIVVIYDGKTKEIISTYEASGKAGGFGLRNFWAASLLKGLKDVKM